jgi:hypothetical protein
MPDYLDVCVGKLNAFRVETADVNAEGCKAESAKPASPNISKKKFK